MLKILNSHENNILKLSPDSTIIEVKKLRGYLLKPAHPEGATTARYLSEIGYNQENFQILEIDPHDQHLTCDAKSGRKSIYGMKYEGGLNHLWLMKMSTFCR